MGERGFTVFVEKAEEMFAKDYSDFPMCQVSAGIGFAILALAKAVSSVAGELWAQRTGAR